ncbi:MAG: hypothetical protein WD941_03130, partial [Opitutus sp.]
MPAPAEEPGLSDLPALATKAAEMDSNSSPPEPAPARDAAPAPAGKQKSVHTAGTPESPEQPGGFFTARTYLIVSIVVLGGVALLVWRIRERQLELAATALSHTPFSAPVRTVKGARFTAEFLGKLEWKRFEELVASYYGKTGVVAVRTKSGPGNPVHIKISWKGEPRPFAC